MAGERKGLILIIVAMLAATGLAVKDHTSPAVSWVVAVADGVAVDPGAAIIATFSEDIDPASIGINSLRLSATDVPVEASVSYDIWTRSAVLAPAVPLKSATTYTATLAPGARDKAGNTLATGHSWSFTTRGDLAHGFGGPVLIVTSAALPFSTYYSEILLATRISVSLPLPPISPFCRVPIS